MQIDRISYQKVFPLGSYTTERIGLEASLDEGENPEEALNKLKVIVDTLHAETITQLDLYRGTQIRDIEEQEVQVKLTPVESMIEAINSCTEVKVLESYRLMAKSNPDLQRAYDKKLEELEK